METNLCRRRILCADRCIVHVLAHPEGMGEETVNLPCIVIHVRVPCGKEIITSIKLPQTCGRGMVNVINIGKNDNYDKV